MQWAAGWYPGCSQWRHRWRALLRDVERSTQRGCVLRGVTHDTRRRGRRSQLVVAEVGVAGALPVVQQTEGPVLRDPSPGVAVPAWHLGHAPGHGGVALVDLDVVTIMDI